MINNKMIPISAKNIKKISDDFVRKNILKYQTVLDRNVKDTPFIYKKKSNVDMNMILEILYHMKTMQHIANSNFQIALQKQYIQNILNVSVVSNQLREVKNLFLSQQNWDTIFVEKAIRYVENILKKNDVLNYNRTKQNNFNVSYSNAYLFNVTNKQKTLNSNSIGFKNINFENKTVHFFTKIATLLSKKNVKYQMLFQNNINDKFFSIIYYLKSNIMLKNQFLKIENFNDWKKVKPILKNFTTNQNYFLNQKSNFYNNNIKITKLPLYTKQFNTFLQYHLQNKNELNILNKQIKYFLNYDSRKYKNAEIIKDSIIQCQYVKKYFIPLNIKSIKQILYENKNIKKRKKQYFYTILNWYNINDYKRTLQSDINKNIKQYFLYIQNEFWKKRNTLLFDVLIKKFDLIELFYVNDTKYYLLKNFILKLKQQKIKFKLWKKQAVLYKQYNKYGKADFLVKQYKNKFHKIIKNFLKSNDNDLMKYNQNIFYNNLYQNKIVEYNNKQNLYSNDILYYTINQNEQKNNILYNFYDNEKEIFIKNKNNNKEIQQNSTYLGIKNLWPILYTNKNKITQYKNLFLEKIKNNKKTENNNIILLNENSLLNTYYKEKINKTIIYFENLLLLKERNNKKEVKYKQNIIILNKSKLLKLFYSNKKRIIYYENIELLEKKNNTKEINTKQNIKVFSKNKLLSLIYKIYPKIVQYKSILLIEKSDTKEIKTEQSIEIFNRDKLLNLLYKVDQRIIQYKNILLIEKNSGREEIKTEQSIEIFNRDKLLNLLYKADQRIIQYKNILLIEKNNDGKKIKTEKNIKIFNKDTLWNLYYKKQQEIAQYKNIPLIEKNDNIKKKETEKIIKYGIWPLLEKNNSKRQIKNKQIKIICSGDILWNLYNKEKTIYCSDIVLSEKKYHKMLLNENNLIILYYQKKEKEIKKGYKKILLKKENMKYKIKQNSIIFYQKNLLYCKKKIKEVTTYKNLLHLLYEQKKNIELQKIKGNLLLLKSENQNNILKNKIIKNRKNEIENPKRKIVYLENRKEFLSYNEDIIFLQKKEMLSEKEKNTIQLQQIIKKEIEILLQKQMEQQQIVLQQYAEEITKEQINFQKQFDKEKIYQQIYQKLERTLYRERRQSGR